MVVDMTIRVHLMENERKTLSSAHTYIFRQYFRSVQPFWKPKPRLHKCGFPTPPVIFPKALALRETQE